MKPGTRIGPYEVISPLGAGGMGEVFRARDTKLGRDVALKILPDAFASDRERLSRFEREARTLAALNHPHIAQIYGFEDRALVMELVEGEDLAQRIARGPIPVDEALAMARQIVDALEAAHEQGIIHRDLKPANIKVRADGAVKVLDFGLAKALSQDPRPETQDPRHAAPTITSPAMTAAGLILGTAAYMSPEQAKGRSVDRRSDIWAFGCVLFEMLTGQRAFPGDDVTETLAAVIKSEPSWAALPTTTPPAIRRLLQRCLQKDYRRRLADIHDARLELEDTSETMPFAPAPARSNRREYVAWGLATLAILSALAIAATTRRRAPEPVRVVHATIPVMFELENAPALRFAVSPDGRAVAFTARDASNKTMLWLRPLDGLTAQAIAGTEGASSPFWSPDSRDIAFIATGKLRRVPATGGPVISLADAVQTPPGAWSKNNVILFTPSGTSPLYQVPAGGGTAKPVTTLDRGSTVLHSFPAFLSDGQRFLYARPGDLNRIIAVGSLDGTITKQIELPESGGNVQFASGHLFFLRENTLMAQRFDEATLSLVGNAVPIAESLLTNTTTGGTGAYSVSPNGVLVYQTRATLGGTVTWLDRSGRATGEIGTAGLYGGLTLASDGRSALAAYEDANQRGLVTFDLVRGFGRRLSVNASLLPISWSSDGGLIFYRRRVPNGGTAIYSAPSNGDGAERPLLENERVNMPLAASPDGQHLLYAVSVAPTRAHLWTLPLAGGPPTPYLETLVLPTQADFSPNGHFVAYVSNEGGRNEVWVATFPKSMGKWQVSTNGGMEPRWSANGKELFYASGAKLMATEVDTTSGTLQIGPTHALFDLPRVGTQVYSTTSPRMADFWSSLTPGAR